MQLPEDLRSLLPESNGVSGEYELALPFGPSNASSRTTFSSSTMHLRGLYMPFDSLLFFADAGNGDQFAFPIVVSLPPGRVRVGSRGRQPQMGCPVPADLPGMVAERTAQAPRGPP